jgi:hypothetical protein
MKRIGLLAVLMAADTFTTIYGIENHSMMEMNPLMVPLLLLGGYTALALAKVAAFGLEVWAATSMRQWMPTGWLRLTWGMILVIAAMPVVANSLLIIFVA